MGCSLRINDHAYRGGKRPLSNAHLAARVLGQTANFLMGLMLLPVAKNSVFTACFGIAWEQVIFVHVFLGLVRIKGEGQREVILFETLYSYCYSIGIRDG